MTDPKVLERKYYEALNARNWDVYPELFTDDVEVVASGGMEGRGIDAIRAFDQGWNVAFPDFVITLQSQAADGDMVMSENVFTGTHTGVLTTPAGDIPPTGASIEGHYVAVVKVRGDKIASFRAYIDRMELLEGLGIVPTPAGA